jgi:RNA polymerase primary sigma factor
MYGDLIEDVNSKTPDESRSTRLRAKELANALSHLNPRMRRVLALRFGLDGETAQTLEAVGFWLGITREHVRQLESRA